MADGDGNTTSPEGNNDIKQLRDALDRKDKRIKELEGDVGKFRARALEGLAHQAGFDPKNGTVKLVLEKFQADDLTDEKLTTEAFTSFAKEWDVAPAPAPAAGGEGNTPSIQDPATQQTAQQVSQLQTPAEQLAAAAANASTPNPNDLRTKVAEAEAAAMKGEGSWDTVFALKTQMVPNLPDGFGVQQGQGQGGGEAPLPTHSPQS